VFLWRSTSTNDGRPRREFCLRLCFGETAFLLVLCWRSALSCAFIPASVSVSGDTALALLSDSTNADTFSIKELWASIHDENHLSLPVMCRSRTKSERDDDLRIPRTLPAALSSADSDGCHDWEN